MYEEYYLKGGGNIGGHPKKQPAQELEYISC
jgi:hypothetical protein